MSTASTRDRPYLKALQILSILSNSPVQLVFRCFKSTSSGSGTIFISLRDGICGIPRKFETWDVSPTGNILSESQYGTVGTWGGLELVRYRPLSVRLPSLSIQGQMATFLCTIAGGEATGPCRPRIPLYTSMRRRIVSHRIAWVATRLSDEAELLV